MQKIERLVAHKNNFLFLIFCSSFIPLFSCEIELLKTIPSIYEQMSGNEIVESEAMGSLVKFVLKAEGHLDNYFAYFRMRTINNKKYLLPIVDDPELQEDFSIDSPKLIKKSNDYALLEGCSQGFYDYVATILKKEVNINAVDYTDYGVIFSLENNGQPCTINEFFSDNFVSNNPKLILENKFFAGDSKKNFTPIAYACQSQSIDILDELIKQGVHIDDEENFKKYIEKFRNDIINSKDQIIKAQNNASINASIPSFSIKKASEIYKPIPERLLIKKLGSIYDKTIALKVFLGKNFIHIEPMEINSYKETFLDVDSLATLYSYLIVWNNEGEYISNVYHRWKIYPLFKKLVFHYVIDELQNKSYAYDPDILPENLIILAKKIIYSFQSTPSFTESYFLQFLLKYFFVLASYHAQWNNYYRDLLELFLKDTQGKNLLKELRQIDEIVCMPLKQEVQIHLLRQYLATILSHNGYSGSPLPFDVTERIANFWLPSKKFIEYVRIPVENRKNHNDDDEQLEEKIINLTLS